MSNPTDAKFCASATYAGTPIPAYYNSLPSAVRVPNMPDCDPNKPKGVDVEETSVAYTVTLTDKSVTPAKVTALVVPALAGSAPPVVPATIPSLVLTISGPTILTPITLKLGGTLGWCTFISANDSGNYGIALSGCLMPPPSK
jgi:hypothetical protein